MMQPMTYQEAKERRDVLEARLTKASAALRAFPKLANGLTPDSVRATAEWKAAKKECDQAFSEVRCFNAVFVKRYKIAIRTERLMKTGLEY